MENYIQADDYELWIIIKNGALVPTKPSEDGNTMIPKEPKEFNSADFKMMEKNAKAKKLLYILALVQMNTYVFPSARPPKTYGTLYK